MFQFLSTRHEAGDNVFRTDDVLTQDKSAARMVKE